MRCKALWVGPNRLWKPFMIIIALVILALMMSEPDDDVIKVVTIREIYTNGFRNISDLHFEDLSDSSHVKDSHHTKHSVGFSDLAGSNCYAAFSGRARNSQFRGNITRWNVSRIQDIAQRDCDEFISVYGMGRYPHPLREELEFPLSFSIVFHKDFDQILFLLRAVYRPHNLYCLHPDKKSPRELQDAAVAVAKCLPNVNIARTQEKVVYAGYSRLKADLNCMKDALDSSVNWRYHINMVGQQFPLKSNLEMVRVLQLFNGTNDIEGITGGARLVNRYKKEYSPRYSEKTGLYDTVETGATNPPPPHNIEVVKGSVFGTFSRPFVEYVISDPVAADVINWAKKVYSPDEYVWAILHHSKALKVPGGKNTGKPDKRLWFNTYANWGEKPCYGKYIHGICIFTTQDLPLLLSRHEFFANKFQIEFHPAALHCLDKLVYHLTITRTVTDLDFYGKIIAGMS